MTAPDVVVVGHVVQDLTPQGSRLGGAGTFASVQAHRLGRSVGVVTRAPHRLLDDPQLAGIAFAGRDSDKATTFENSYDGSSRRQRVPSRAAPITADDVPEGWRSTDVVLLGPVCGEIPHDFERLFTDSLVGIGAQGWLRALDENGAVRPAPWNGPPFWQGAHALFVSDEDLVAETQLDRWVEEVPVVVVTRERRGARVHDGGRWREIDAFPANEVDPTGAGDVFAAAFLVWLDETGDVGGAAQFASAAAAFAVEAEGIKGIANRDQIGERLAQHPELMLA